MPIPTCPLWMPCLPLRTWWRVRQLGDTRRWPLPTTQCPVLPHGYHAARKAGIKPLFGMEANIVEDSVPIAYNEADVVLSEATYVVFDVETTGLSAVNNALIQIAASKMHKGNIIAEFDEFIDPGHPLSQFTTDLTGITDEHVRGSKPLEQVLREFQDFCQDSVMVAHNATFDVGFMNVNYERAGLPIISQPVIDTLNLLVTSTPTLSVMV